MDDYLGIREVGPSLRMMMQMPSGVLFDDFEISVYTRGDCLQHLLLEIRRNCSRVPGFSPLVGMQESFNVTHCFVPKGHEVMV
jgi:hypothetical protein